MKPSLPQGSCCVGQHVFGGEPLPDRKLTSPFASNQYTVRYFHDTTRYLRCVPHVSQTGNSARAACGTVHDRRVQLDNTFSIRQTTVTHSQFVGVVFNARGGIDARVQRAVSSLEQIKSFGRCSFPVV